MRIENMTLTIKMPLPINKPDGNGLIYTKKACIEGFKNAKNKPFIIMQKYMVNGLMTYMSNTQIILKINQ